MAIFCSLHFCNFVEESKLAGHHRFCIGKYDKLLSADAGLAVEALLPRVRTEDVKLLDADTLNAIRRLDDRPTIADLTSRMVRAVLRKP